MHLVVVIFIALVLTYVGAIFVYAAHWDLTHKCILNDKLEVVYVRRDELD